MSTNINPGLPDVAELEKLANQFFAAQPGSAPVQTQAVQPGAGVQSQVSPSAIEQGNAINMDNPQTSLPDPHFIGSGNLPQSVAGSGISPSALQQQAVSDPGFNGIPFAQTEWSFEAELRRALSALHHLPGSQAGYTAIYQSGAPSYYFLPESWISQAHQVNHTAQQATASVNTAPAISTPPFDVNLVKQDFPILRETVNGRPLVWLDNAATTQKPQQVIDRLSEFYAHENSNIHRAAHELAARATDAYENARKKVQGFLNASSVNEIVFVRGTTEAINLVAKGWGEQFLQEGDEILISYLEHHANIVPWQQLAAKKGLRLKVAPVDDNGQVILDEYGKLLTPKTKLVSFTQVSNALGTITPAKTMVEMAHQAGAKVLVDGAQAVSHMRADVQDLNCDWYVFSGHKVFGPTGIGVLYGKEALLNETAPWQGGGNMIEDVTFEHTRYHKSPARFEAGTGNIADAVGLGAAIDYVNRIGIHAIEQYEHGLLQYATQLLKNIPGLRLIGTAAAKAGVLSFVLEGFRTEDIGNALNREGIAVRSGHHCAQPILRRFGVESTVRPSLAFYNTCADIDLLVTTIQKLNASRARHF